MHVYTFPLTSSLSRIWLSVAIVEYMNIYAIQILCRRHKWLTLPARAVWLSVNIYFVYVCVCMVYEANN